MLYLFQLILNTLSKKDLLHLKSTINNVLYKHLSHTERSRLLWDHKKYNRRLYISPFSPSKSDLLIYKRLLLKEIGNSARVLLLGSTPLLRHLLEESGFKKYVLVDFSFKAVEGSTHVLARSNINIDSDNEIWIKCDWFSIPLQPESIDCIIGDLVLTQIEPKTQKEFIVKIHSLLREKGAFIGRMHTSDLSIEGSDPQVIIKNFFNNPNFKDTVEQQFLLLYALRSCLRDRKKQMTAINDIVEALLKYHTTDDTELSFLRNAVEISIKRIELRTSFVTQTKEELEGLLKEYFSIKETMMATDYDSQQFPMYLLHKKST